MTKARVLADFISDGSPLADGTISVSEVSGAAPIESPTFTGNVTSESLKIVNGTSGELQLWGSAYNIQGGTNYGDMRFNAPRLRFYEDSSRIVEISGGSTYFFGSSIFNEDGIDKDFRVESLNKTHMLFVDAAQDKVGINESTPEYTLDVGGASTGSFIAARLHNKDNTSGSGVALNLQNSAFGGINEGEIRYTNNGVNNNNNLSFHGEIAGVNGLVQLGAFEGGGGQWVTQRGAVFNESGINSDFRVESDNNTHALFVDASADTVHIGTNTGAELVNINQTGRSNKIGLNIVNADSGNGANTMFNLTNNADQDFQIKVSEVGATTKSTYIGPSTNTQLNITGASVGSLNRDLYLDSASLVVNQDSRNYDFRVESDLNTHALFVDSSSRMVGIEQSAPAYLLDVGNGSSSIPGGYTLRINSIGDTIFSLSKANQSMMSFRNDGYGYTAIASNNGSKLMLGYSANDAGAIANHLYFQVSETIVNEGGIDRDFRVESDGATHMLYVDAGNDCVNIATTQTEAMFGGGKPSSGYVQQFTGSSMIKFAEFGAGSSTPAQTITTVINLSNYRAICVKVNTSGHLWNNGGSFYNRVTEFYLAIEGTSTRINQRVDVIAAGSQIGQCGIPAVTVSGTGQFSITQTIGAGYSANTFIEVTGIGCQSIGNITKA